MRLLDLLVVLLLVLSPVVRWSSDMQALDGRLVAGQRTVPLARSLTRKFVAQPPRRTARERKNVVPEPQDGPPETRAVATSGKIGRKLPSHRNVSHGWQTGNRHDCGYGPAVTEAHADILRPRRPHSFETFLHVRRGPGSSAAPRHIVPQRTTQARTHDPSGWDHRLSARAGRWDGYAASTFIPTSAP